MRVAVIGSKTMSVAFSLGGVTDSIAVYDGGEVDVETARDRFKTLTADEDVGIIVINDKVALALKREIERFHALKRVVPIIMELPDEEGEVDDRIARVIRRAVGIDVNR